MMPGRFLNGSQDCRKLQTGSFGTFFRTYCLPHLLFPDTFERIATERQKRLILATFTESPAKELKKWALTDIDKGLLDLRRIKEKRGSEIDFYEDEFVKDWLPKAPPKSKIIVVPPGTEVVQPTDVTEPLNLILYGPPGTGKTYRLQQYYIPRYKDGDRFEFVTFHQSYAYEDFVEGIRPMTVNGRVTYEVRPGVLRRLCERARKNPGHRYALFIDEISRGNIAKVFDELITLIETDKRLRFDENGNRTDGLEVTLPYSGQRFGVPANIDLIGTMNTADRSIALLDTGLRRRFQSVEMMPRADKIKGAQNGIIPDDDEGEIDLRKLLEMLNSRLTHFLHRDQTIGHAYFTKVRDFAGLRRVMAREIVPLLQEYFYDDWRQIRLVLADNSVPPEYQIVHQSAAKPEELFPGAESAELGESHLFEVTPEAAISADAIRKIYEPR